jgi:Asp/Glu/hydantoin racemase
MADYAKVVRETDSIELRGISSSALNELLLVKRAISFFETMKRISYCLRVGMRLI